MTLKERLLENLGRLDQPSDSFLEAKSALDEAIEAIEASLANEAVEVGYEVGHNATYGLQHNVYVRLREGRFKDIVFRAYIPFDGYPVRLDLFGDELAICEERKVLDDCLAEYFQTPELRNRLLMLRSLR